MKRIIALAWVAALILCVGAAQAAEWREGLGPGQPYTNAPEVDLTEQLGYMMFYPNQNMTMETFCQTLYIYLPREDVTSGDGVLHLNTVEDGLVLSIAMNDTEAIRQRAMIEDELDIWMWGSGSCFEIHLPRTLEFGKTYFVTMTQSCIVTEGGIDSPAIDNPYAWRFALAGDYGIGGLEYQGLNEEGATIAQAGDEISFDLVLGGEAASAALYSRDASVDFPVTFFEESSPVTGIVTSDSPAWGVMFFDAEGSKLSQMEF
ncbi:MAG: hypothetical protein J1E43_08890 [Christensenellaceae bacterium]|nr:hypothetical protein [Christensenellaceae bacterium]